MQQCIKKKNAAEVASRDTCSQLEIIYLNRDDRLAIERGEDDGMIVLQSDITRTYDSKEYL